MARAPINTASNDLAAISAHSIKYAVKHPKTDAETGLILHLRWFGDEKVKSVQRDITNKQLKLSQRRKTFTAKELEASTVDQLVAAIEGWEWTNGATWHGEALDFNEHNVRKVLTEAAWLMRQVDEALANDADFF